MLKRLQFELYILGSLLVLHPLLMLILDSQTQQGLPIFEFITVGLGFFVLAMTPSLGQQIKNDQRWLWYVVRVLLGLLLIFAPVSILLTLIQGYWVDLLLNLVVAGIMIGFLAHIHHQLKQQFTSTS